MKNLNVLVVDDKLENLVTFQKLCSAPKFLEEFQTVCSGFDVVATQSANEAFELLQSQTFDIVVTDLFMPLEKFSGFLSSDEDLAKRSAILGNIPMGFFVKMKAQQVGVPNIAIVSAMETHGSVRSENSQLEAYVGEILCRTGFGLYGEEDECAVFPGYVMSGSKEYIDHDGYIDLRGYAHCMRQLLLGDSQWEIDFVS
jgi:CheY-like chemotaxis protein